MSLSGDLWRDATVFITGVCGTVGKELLRQVTASDAAMVMGFDNNESEMFFLAEEYRGQNSRVKLFLGDLRDRDSLLRRMRGADIVLHAAALKHVILCEESPRDPIQTNIIGTQNVIDAAQANGVKRVVFTSSDKAVNPTNVMGTSKLMGERLVTAANAHRARGDGVFTVTRFGNVLGSSGSVIPLFKKQIAAGGPVTLTDPGMTRFVMTLEEAARLVLDSVSLACGGEVFVTKMAVVRIEDLAHVMIEELAPVCGRDPQDIVIQVIGSKAGEKLYEELMNEEEIRRTLELEDYFVVTPAFKGIYEEVDYRYPDTVSDGVDKPYHSSSEPAMSREQLREYLHASGLLDMEVGR